MTDSKQTIMSAIMHAFQQSKIPQFGGEKPFTLSCDKTEFEACSWWDVEEHMTIGVVLDSTDKLLMAIMAMHDYIIEQWNDAAKELETNSPATPAHEYMSNGIKRTITEYYSVTSLRSFPYVLALIIPEKLVSDFIRYTLPEYGFEVYVVKPNGNIGLMYTPDDGNTD